MASPQKPSPEILKIAQEYIDAGLPYSLISKKMKSVSPTQLSHWVRCGYLARNLLPDEKVYNDYFRLKGDWIISSDYHIPYSDMKLIRLMIKIAKKFRVKNLLVAGDFLDQAMFSEFFVQEEGDFESELITAKEIFRLLNKSFEDIRFLSGNHDIRLLKMLKFKLKLSNFFKMIDGGMKISNYPFCIINDKWRITHAKNYSRLATRVALAMTHKFKMSVGVAHGHAMGVTYSPSGEEICFDTGGIFDQSKIEYKNLIDTTHPDWISGFSMIRNNFLYSFPKKHTDWDWWLKE